MAKGLASRVSGLTAHASVSRNGCIDVPFLVLTVTPASPVAVTGSELSINPTDRRPGPPGPQYTFV